MSIPAKANFYLQKNIKILLDAAKEIDSYRLSIAQTYGTLDETSSQYIIKPELNQKAMEELNDLFTLTQDLNITMISIEAFKDVLITEKQMKAIMFMLQ